MPALFPRSIWVTTCPASPLHPFKTLQSESKYIITLTHTSHFVFALCLWKGVQARKPEINIFICRVIHKCLQQSQAFAYRRTKRQCPGTWCIALMWGSSSLLRQQGFFSLFPSSRCKKQCSTEETQTASVWLTAPQPQSARGKRRCSIRILAIARLNIYRERCLEVSS